VLLKRPFSHNHLVGALRGLESNLTIVLLDFLINKGILIILLFILIKIIINLLKVKKTSKWKTEDENEINIIELAAWIGAVVDAHPTTITTDGNEEYLREALAVVNTKVDTYRHPMFPNDRFLVGNIE